MEKRKKNYFERKKRGGKFMLAFKSMNPGKK
jgi:hypothetical protein